LRLFVWPAKQKQLQPPTPRPPALEEAEEEGGRGGGSASGSEQGGGGEGGECIRIPCGTSEFGSGVVEFIREPLIEEISQGLVFSV
jgi:hypothetical protein